jgi:primosomal protein N' (replication factor Y) (superfamily II helicase)
MIYLCTVILDIPYQKGWSYLYNKENNNQLYNILIQPQIQVGSIVKVPVANRKLIGIITHIEPYDEEIHKFEFNLRYIQSISNIILPLSFIDMVSFMARYYHEGIGEVAMMALPSYFKKIQVKGFDNWDFEDENTETKSIKAVKLKVKPNIIKPTLTSEQSIAIQNILQHMQYSVHLLQGVTGSGKTEVYLNLIEHHLSINNQAQILLILPEINLTPQTLKIIKKRFSDVSIAVLHSKLTEKKRASNWYSAYSAKANIVIGTRMACMAILPNISLIIIDEEHDLSYKQQESIRYNARNIAIWRAKYHNIPIVLGTATPSLESYKNALSAKYHHHILSKRATEISLPKVHLVDMSGYYKNQTLGIISPVVLSAMHSSLELGQQVLLFLNRRGFAPVLFCSACKYTFDCNQCSASLVLHKSQNQSYIQCHHCGHTEKYPDECPKCKHTQILPIGYGTQRLEQTLQDNFSNYRTIRIDSDTTSKKNELEDKFNLINTNKANIIIGTQMLSKGHDFKNLGLVAVLNPDGMLYSYNFRSREYLFAQLMQVLGRAGRHIEGNVYIQTSFVQDPLYLSLQKHSYDEYATNLLKEREILNFAPYGYEASIYASSSISSRALHELNNVYLQIKNISRDHGYGKILISKPLPHSMLKHSGMERAYINIYSDVRLGLHGFIDCIMSSLQNLKCDWYIDIIDE